MPKTFHEVVASVPVAKITRIDVGLEGDWSGSVVPVWTRESGALGFDAVVASHPTHRPSLELYFDCAWVGMHCFRATAAGNVFDADLAAQVVRWVELQLQA